MHPRSFGRRLLVCGVWLAGCLPLGAAEGPVRSDWGPFYSEVEDPTGNLRRRALGPVLERTTSSEGHRFWAVRPAASRIADAADRRSRVEVLWPVAIGRRLDDQSSLRFLTGWFVDYDVHDPESPYRAWVLPIYYQGRDRRDRGYFAFFPIGGTIKDFLGRDDVTFALFPLMVKTTFEDLDTLHLAWPIFKRGVSDDTDRLRVFPLYQHNRMEDQHRKLSILWPIWNSVEYTRAEHEGSGYILFPLWGHIDVPDEETWMVLPPLFRFTVSDTLNRSYVPYPLFQFSSGEVEKAYAMPLWGSKIMGGSSRTFFLWPIFWRMQIDKGDAVTRRTFVLPVFFLTTTRERSLESDGDGEVRRRNLHLWPVFSYRRDGAASVTRAFDLWPPSWRGPIERNFAPFWSVYVRTWADDAVSEEVLWGLYRRYVRGDDECYWSVFPFVQGRSRHGASEERSLTVLKGLLGYRRTPHGRSWRLLYLFTLGKGEDRP